MILFVFLQNWHDVEKLIFDMDRLIFTIKNQWFTLFFTSNFVKYFNLLKNNYKFRLLF